MMPIDRAPQNNLKPKLASHRTAKTPLTPRLAAAPSQPATATGAQPTRTVRTGNATTPRVSSTVNEDVTPVKAFLNSNVTPRSSSRKSRVGVESTLSSPSGTPIKTPSSSRPASTIDFAPKDQGAGYSAPALASNKSAQGGVRPRSTPGPIGPQLAPPSRPPLSSIRHSVPDAGSAKSTSPLFFLASDARPQEQQQQQQPPPKKTPTFFYANGKQDAPSRRSDVTSPPLSLVGRSQSEAKFFHADTVSEARRNPPNLTPSPMSTSPEPVHLNPPPPPRQARSPSPTKEWAHLSYRKGASQVMRPSIASRNSAMSILSGPPTPDVPDRPSRRSSAASYVMRGSHGKSASLSSIDSVTDPKHMPSTEPAGHAPSPLTTEKRVVSISSLPSPPLVSFSGLPSPTSASPSKPNGTQSALETMNELAANARRERKVLDLEISNSSLLAINRSLEKEVRKQKAEIRRFRRMSRAGHFSVDAAGAPLDTSPLHSATHIGELSDMSEEDEADQLEEPDEEEPGSSEESFDESQLSPSAQLERDETHRFKDEKRLQLDLSKHRDLLLDSQKMNQSLKRCMNWTEQLIKDGQKALEYQVRPSDVKLGGRVLIVEDDDDEHDTMQAEESKGLLSPWSPLHRSIEGLEALDSPFFAGAIERIVDRDSGVEIDGLNTLAPPIPGSRASLGSPFEERIQRLQATIEALS